MMDGGLRLVSGGTDNHLCLVDLTPADVTGKDAEKLLESVGLTVNKNSIPKDVYKRQEPAGEFFAGNLFYRPVPDAFFRTWRDGAEAGSPGSSAPASDGGTAR